MNHSLLIEIQNYTSDEYNYRDMELSLVYPGQEEFDDTFEKSGDKVINPLVPRKV